MSIYRVALDEYNGPLDLLLFLIRRDEVDIHHIPIAKIAEQYVAYVDVMRKLDPEAAGDFLVMAATLMEIKSRLLLPKPPPEELDEDISDPRTDLVRQLLEYKKFKDSAYALGQRAQDQALRHPRRPAQTARDPEEVELDHLEIWDLVDSFNRLLEQTGRKSTVHRIEVDDTPIMLHAEDILDALERSGGRLMFADVFAGRSRGEMIGLFLALLELVRNRRVGARQEGPRRPIFLVLIEEDVEAAMEAQDQEAPGHEAPGEPSGGDLAARSDNAAVMGARGAAPVAAPSSNAHDAPNAEQNHETE